MQFDITSVEVFPLEDNCDFSWSPPPLCQMILWPKQFWHQKAQTFVPLNLQFKTFQRCYLHPPWAGSHLHATAQSDVCEVMYSYKYSLSLFSWKKWHHYVNILIKYLILPYLCATFVCVKSVMSMKQSIW